MAQKVKKFVVVETTAMKQLSLRSGSVSLKCDLPSIELSLFSWLKRGACKVRVNQNQRTGERAEIHPSSIGSATVWDQAILNYLFALLVQAIDDRDSISRTISFKALDLLRAANRGEGGASYKELKNALDRLVGTRITTNVPTGGQVETESFSLLSSYQVLESEKGRMKSICVVIPSWFFRSIKCGKFISLTPEYFSLRSAFKRRLYQLVRKHCGQQAGFQIGLERLHKKSGTDSSLSDFKCKLKKFVGLHHQALLDYRVVIRGEVLYAFSVNDRGHKALHDFLRANL